MSGCGTTDSATHLSQSFSALSLPASADPRWNCSWATFAWRTRVHVCECRAPRVRTSTHTRTHAAHQPPHTRTYLQLRLYLLQLRLLRPRLLQFALQSSYGRRQRRLRLLAGKVLRLPRAYARVSRRVSAHSCAMHTIAHASGVVDKPPDSCPLSIPSASTPLPSAPHSPSHW